MSMPTFQEVMLPILSMASDSNVHSLKESVDFIEQKFQLTAIEKQERVPSGKMRTIYNRVTWAVTYLKNANLIEACQNRGEYKITDKGKEFLATKPSKITIKVLDALNQGNKNYKAFTKVDDTKQDAPFLNGFESDEKTPEETIGMLAEQLNLELANNLLDSICNNSPIFFENLVVDLLLKMGYGGSEGLGEVTKASGDGGIDGVIKQDVLGLDMIYIQAKRWNKNTTVGRPEIQKFVGALSGEGVIKGVFITTANFLSSAISYAQSVKNTKIILIDGIRLCKLMIKYDLGVTTCNTIRIKKIDLDYFEEQ